LILYVYIQPPADLTDPPYVRLRTLAHLSFSVVVSLVYHTFRRSLKIASRWPFRNPLSLFLPLGPSLRPADAATLSCRDASVAHQFHVAATQLSCGVNDPMAPQTKRSLSYPPCQLSTSVVHPGRLDWTTSDAQWTPRLVGPHRCGFEQGTGAAARCVSWGGRENSGGWMGDGRRAQEAVRGAQEEGRGGAQVEAEEGNWDVQQCCCVFRQGELEQLQLDALDDDDDEPHGYYEHQGDYGGPDELGDKFWDDPQLDHYDWQQHEGRLVHQHVETVVDAVINGDEYNIDAACVCSDVQCGDDGYWDRYPPSTDDLRAPQRTGIVPRRITLPYRRSQHLLAV
jgi:hypothetical protein